jgi:hypothetical protein
MPPKRHFHDRNFRVHGKRCGYRIKRYRDLIVKLSKPKSLLSLVRLERNLSEALGKKVDLLTEGAISPHLKERILKELTVIYEA